MRRVPFILLVAIVCPLLAVAQPTKDTEITCNGVTYLAVRECPTIQHAMGSSGTEFWVGTSGTSGGNGCVWTFEDYEDIEAHGFDHPRPGYTPIPSASNAMIGVPARSYGPSLAPTITGFRCVCPGGVTEYTLQVPPIDFSAPTFVEHGIVSFEVGSTAHELARTRRDPGQPAVIVDMDGGYYHFPADQVLHNGNQSNPYIYFTSVIEAIGNQQCQSNQVIISTTYQGYDYIKVGFKGTHPQQTYPEIPPQTYYGTWVTSGTLVTSDTTRYAPDWELAASNPARNVKVFIVGEPEWTLPPYAHFTAEEQAEISLLANLSSDDLVFPTLQTPPGTYNSAAPYSGAWYGRLRISDPGNPGYERHFYAYPSGFSETIESWMGELTLAAGQAECSWDGNFYGSYGTDVATSSTLLGQTYDVQLTIFFENYTWDPLAQGGAGAPRTERSEEFSYTAQGERVEDDKPEKMTPYAYPGDTSVESVGEANGIEDPNLDDPVSLANGEFYHPEIDLKIPGRGMDFV